MRCVTGIFTARQQRQGIVEGAIGARLEQALATPVGDVAPIEGIEDAIPIRALNL